MRITDIKKQSNAFLKGGLFISVALVLAGLLISQVWFVDGLLVPLVVSFVFSVVIDGVDAFLWRRIAIKSPDNLPNFFIGMTGLRMFMALLVLFVVYLNTDKEGMLRFFLTFVVFYLTLLVHHSVFFSRLLKRSTF